MSPDVLKSGNGEIQRSAYQVGRFAAIFSSFLGALYLLGLLARWITTGSLIPRADSLVVLSASVAILWDITLVVLFTVLRFFSPIEKKFYSDLALVFMVLMCSTSSISWFFRLAIIPNLAETMDPSVFRLMDPINNASIPFALEHLGWGLFYALGAIFSGFSFSMDPLERWIKLLLISGGVVSLIHLAGVLINSDTLFILGYLAWGLLLPITSVLLAKWIANFSRTNGRTKSN